MFASRAKASVNVRLRRIGVKAALDGVRGAKFEDINVSESSLAEVAASIRRYRPDAIIGLGDMIAARGDSQNDESVADDGAPAVRGDS